MQLYKILDKNCCQTKLSIKTKTEALKKISVQAKKSEILSDLSEDFIFNQLNEREKQGSTGFGNGIALPHARLKELEQFLFFIITVPGGVKFEASDKKKVKLFFVVFGPADQPEEYLKILAEISRTISSKKLFNSLIKSSSSEALYETFLKETRFMENKGDKKEKLKLLFLVLYIDDLIYDILEFFIQEDIEGATILESTGMGQYVSAIPLFAGFLNFMSEKKNHSKTIIATIPESKLQTITAGIEKITGDLNEKQGAMIFTVDISHYKGSMKML
ncbi:MAG: PTS sugar transporter subunit IIA [Myxococcota bacterium]